jgi:hypothetical protein
MDSAVRTPFPCNFGAETFSLTVGGLRTNLGSGQARNPNFSNQARNGPAPINAEAGFLGGFA